MPYALFLGIFGLPVVAAVGMVVARVLNAFAPEEPQGPGCTPEDDLHGTEAHMGALVDAFFAAPREQNPKQ